MFQRTSIQWMWILAFAASLSVNQVASAQWGVGFGRGGYGGIYGQGFYGGYGNLGAFGPGFYPAYGFGGPGFGPGFGAGNLGYGYGLGNGFSYAQPIYSTYNQPLYSTRVFSPQIYTLRTFTPLNGSGLTYSGSSPVMTSSPPVVINVPRSLSIVPRSSSSTAASSLPSSSQGTYDQGEIVLFSPPTNTREVKYLLNGASYTMKPGSLQKFINDRTWVIEADLGNGRVVNYTLSTGQYKFKQTDSDMNLFTTKDRPEAPAPSPETVESPAAEAIPPAPLAPVPMPVE